MVRRFGHLLGTALLVGAVVVAATDDAEAGRRTTAIKRQVRAFVGKPAPAAVISPRGGTIALPLADRPVWSSFGKNDAKGAAVKQASRRLGRRIARAGFILGTGGGKGLPKDAETGAFFAGGDTVAFTPKGTVASHAASHDGDVFQTSHLVLTGTGGGTGTIAREGPMAEATDVGSFTNGGSGTFGELMALLHNERGVVALMEGTGGVADAARGWMAGGYLNAKPTFEVVSDRDPDRLVRKATAALGRVGRRPPVARRDLVSPGPARSILAEGERADRVVASFLLDDVRATPADRRQNRALARAWAAASGRLAARGTTALFPAGGDASALAAAIADGGGEGVIVAPGRAPRASRAGVRTVGLGHPEGREAARFAAAREVTQEAAVVFLASADYHNMAGLAYALRDPAAPILAVLATPSTHGDKIPAIVAAIEPTKVGQVVVGRTPAELVARVEVALRARAAGPAASGDDGRAGLD